MALTVRRKNRTSVIITRIPDGKLTVVKRLARDSAEVMQKRMHQAFEKERYGGGTLGRNSSKYTLAKALGGFDLRRGHGKGALAKAIRNQRLWTVKRDGKAIVISFDINRISGVPARYAKFYERRKARRKLLSLAEGWIKECAALIRKGLKADERKEKRTRRGRGVRLTTERSGVGERIGIA